tara:strand:- start:205 stop:1578 length:1374 start_codon:yes stop_codon:yes gene_type:complete
MTILRENPGDVEISVSIFRDGEKLKTPTGEYDIKDFVKGFQIYESITSSTMEAKIVIEDSAGLVNTFTGSELFKVQIMGSIIDRTFFMRSYTILSRSRTNQDTDVYVINLASDEFIKNEAVNIFGMTDVIFKNKTETSQIVEDILKSNRYIGTRKRLYLEETLNDHKFIIPNWRPFDAIYWMTERSIRKSSGSSLQNGFAFFENALGYHYKSIDKMIDDANAMKDNEETNINTGQPRLYRYTQAPKNLEGDGAADQYRINAVVFPEEKNFLMGLRHGAWSGYSIGFDPTTITQSKMGISTDISVDAHYYNINTYWNSMSHLKDGGNKNIINSMDQGIQKLIEYPKRVRYTILPNQIFDQRFEDNPQKNYESLVELQAYQWMRIESLKTIKLQITIPGNMDLYVGSGIDIVIPTSAKSGKAPKVDRRYSGRYLIASLTHDTNGLNMTTELLLMKDSTI